MWIFILELLLHVFVPAGDIFYVLNINWTTSTGDKMTEPDKLVKMEVDYSDTVDKTLPEMQEMAKVGHKKLILIYLL